MPSFYEPSGLTQLYAMKYGTIPVVRATGGLKDSVTQYDRAAKTGTGFLFEQFDKASFLEAVDNAISIYRQKEAWTRLMRNAMKADFSWNSSGKKYEAVYRGLTGR
jgi:starch synthase